MPPRQIISDGNWWRPKRKRGPKFREDLDGRSCLRCHRSGHDTIVKRKTVEGIERPISHRSKSVKGAFLCHGCFCVLWERRKNSEHRRANGMVSVGIAEHNEKLL